jgi:hypothetical protein
VQACVVSQTELGSALLLTCLVTCSAATPGVSNYRVTDLQELLSYARIKVGGRVGSVSKRRASSLPSHLDAGAFSLLMLALVLKVYMLFLQMDAACLLQLVAAGCQPGRGSPVPTAARAVDLLQAER